jgi:hypothetical protein
MRSIHIVAGFLPFSSDQQVSDVWDQGEESGILYFVMASVADDKAAAMTTL